MCAVVGFGATVRNVIQKTFNNRDAFTNYKSHGVTLWNELKLTEVSFVKWLETWKLYNFLSPVLLTRAYWGDKGNREINQIIHNLQVTLAKVLEAFTRGYGHALGKAQEEFELRNNILNIQELGAELRPASKGNCKYWSDIVGFCRKLQGVFYQDEIFRRNLDMLKHDISNLDRLSRSLFVDKWGIRKKAWGKSRRPFAAARTSYNKSSPSHKSRVRWKVSFQDVYRF